MRHSKREMLLSRRKHLGSRQDERSRGKPQQERCHMAQLQIVCPLRPGTQERWRRLAQEVAGSRQEQFEAFCREAGIIQVQVWVAQLQRGELLLMTLQTQEPQLALAELAISVRPFDRWLREQ